MTETRKGELFLFAGTALWSFFPIITILSLKSLGPIIALALTVFFSVLFFAGVVFYRKSWTDFSHRETWPDLLLSAVILGIIYYVLYFIGLQYTTAGNASLIGTMEVFTSFVFFNLFRREKMPKTHIIGAFFMVLGAVVIFLPQVLDNFKINIGDLLIFFAMCFAPVGNFFQQRARKTVGPETILLTRTVVAVPVFFLLAWAVSEHFVWTEVLRALPYLLVSGLLLFGLSKLFWIEAIHRISVTKAISLSSISPLLTLFFAYLILGQTPTTIQLVSFIPLFVGILLLTDQMPKFGIF